MKLMEGGPCILIKHDFQFDEGTARQLLEKVGLPYPKPVPLRLGRFQADGATFIAPDFSSEDFCIVHRCSRKNCIDRELAKIFEMTRNHRSTS
jgi:hypothetical protein